MDALYTIKQLSGPLISLALHDGHFIEEEVLNHIALKEHERFREEDPYTAEIGHLPITRVKVYASRFMLDLNRPVQQAIYKIPSDAWGLQVWQQDFPKRLEAGLLDYYYQFYKDIAQLIEEKIEHYGYFMILDIHSYNHRRESPVHSADKDSNPELNLGTFYNRPKWDKVIDSFSGYLSACKVRGDFMDVRKNVVFKGGGFTQWVNQHYGEQGCVISLEFKKTFMDEWTGRADLQHIRDLNRALRGSIPLLNRELIEMHR